MRMVLIEGMEKKESMKLLNLLSESVKGSPPLKTTVSISGCLCRYDLFSSMFFVTSSLFCPTNLFLKQCLQYPPQTELANTKAVFLNLCCRPLVTVYLASALVSGFPFERSSFVDG